MRWAELNSRKIALLTRGTVCLFPIGAIEQHGPHLPVATDRIIAEAVFEIVVPTIKELLAAHWLDAPGVTAMQNSFAWKREADSESSAIGRQWRAAR